MEHPVISAIQQEKLIVIVRGVKKEQLIPMAEALWRGGIRLLEVTYSANGAVSDKETAERIQMLAKHFEGRMYIGAGTVLTEQQVELTHAAGGTFIISPDTYAPVIQKTKALGLVSIPGALRDHRCPSGGSRLRKALPRYLPGLCLCESRAGAPFPRSSAGRGRRGRNEYGRIPARGHCGLWRGLQHHQ